jgi:hypothetical protein
MPEIFTNESNFVCRATRTCLDGLRRSLVRLCTIIPSVRFKPLILQCSGVTIGKYRTRPSENGKVRRSLLDQRRQTRLIKLNDLCALSSRIYFSISQLPHGPFTTFCFTRSSAVPYPS